MTGRDNLFHGIIGGHGYPNKEETAIAQPLYNQVRQKLLAGIETGEWKPGARLPNEDRLAAMFGVSRVTVRRAVKDLCEAGLLQRVQGAGTFVRAKVYEFSLAGLDFGAVVEGGIYKFLQSRTRQPTQDETAAFCFKNQDTTLEEVSRLLMKDSVVIAIQKYFLPHAWFSLSLRNKIAHGEIMLPDNEFPPPKQIRQTAQAQPPSAKQASLLGLAHGAACLVIHREVFCDEGLLYRMETVVDGRRVVLVN
ncbi:MAG: GntR family transcriptional regulator [Clostridia bacterium]|nr:GntR family transcriptional regulator [Clostridia bacterium]